MGGAGDLRLDQQSAGRRHRSSQNLPIFSIETAIIGVEVIALPLTGNDTDVHDLANIFLSQEELQRAGRAISLLDRTAKLGSQLLLRIALSRRLGGNPASWCFRRASSGQSALAGHGSGRAKFSVARSPGMVVVATTANLAVGVDIETAQRLRGANLDSCDWLTPLEISVENHLGVAQRDRERLRRWTLKEAYSKALGQGFSIPPREVGFDLSVDLKSARLEAQVATRGWRFETFNIGGETLVSLAVAPAPAGNG